MRTNNSRRRPPGRRMRALATDVPPEVDATVPSASRMYDNCRPGNSAPPGLHLLISYGGGHRVGEVGR
jgi:hypothetical protein